MLYSCCYKGQTQYECLYRSSGFRFIIYFSCCFFFSCLPCDSQNIGWSWFLSLCNLEIIFQFTLESWMFNFHVHWAMDCEFVALKRSWLRKGTPTNVTYKWLGASVPPLMRQNVWAFVKDFVAPVEQASEDGAGLACDVAENFDALALPIVVGVG